ASGDAHAQRATPHPATTRLTTFAKSPLPSPARGEGNLVLGLSRERVMAFWSRFLAVFIKEFVQMRRDRITFAMMVGVPLMQLILFGYAINSDPKALPTAVVMGDSSTFGRSIVTALQNSEYFRIVGPPVTEAEADELLRLGEVQFVVTIPVDFSRDLVRGDRPTMLVEADATDPAATSNAIAALISLNETALDHDLTGPLAHLKNEKPPFDLQIHRRYNEEG